MVQFLELGLGQVGETPYLLVVALLQLLPAEDEAVLREVEHEPVVPLLLRPVLRDVAAQVAVVQQHPPLLLPAYGQQDHRKADGDEHNHGRLEDPRLGLLGESVKRLPDLNGHTLTLNIIRNIQ